MSVPAFEGMFMSSRLGLSLVESETVVCDQYGHLGQVCVFRVGEFFQQEGYNLDAVLINVSVPEYEHDGRMIKPLLARAFDQNGAAASGLAVIGIGLGSVQ